MNAQEELAELRLVLSDWSTSDSDSDDENHRLQLQVDYYRTLDAMEFQVRFRLSKTLVQQLLEEIFPFLRVKGTTYNSVSPLSQLLLALRFYALGTMLLSVADFIGVSKSTASNIVRDVSFAIAQLYQKYVFVRPNTEEDFYAIARFPRVLGALDCTHVKTQSPSGLIGEEFRNRKGTFSINVQAICDANLLFMDVVARWPGSAHDATIFNNSQLKVRCEAGTYGNKWLLGDSAYPLKSYLLTPLVNPQTPGEILYNESQIRTRNCIERCFGVWKRRFPVVALTLRLQLLNAHSVIIATSVLHNICRLNLLEDVPPEVEIPLLEPEPDAVDDLNPGNAGDGAIQDRRNLISIYFDNLN